MIQYRANKRKHDTARKSAAINYYIGVFTPIHIPRDLCNLSTPCQC